MPGILMSVIIAKTFELLRNTSKASDPLLAAMTSHPRFQHDYKRIQHVWSSSTTNTMWLTGGNL